MGDLIVVEGAVTILVVVTMVVAVVELVAVVFTGDLIRLHVLLCELFTFCLSSRGAADFKGMTTLQYGRFLRDQQQRQQQLIPKQSDELNRWLPILLVGKWKRQKDGTGGGCRGNAVHPTSPHV